MATLEKPFFQLSQTLQCPTLLRRFVRGSVVGSPPAFRILKAVRAVRYVRMFKHAALSFTLKQQWHAQRCRSSWSRA